MIELLSNPLVDFVSRVALPGLSVLVAIFTLLVVEALAKLLADSGTNVQGLVQTGHWGQGIGVEAPIHEETQARLGIERGSGRRCRLLR